MAAVRASPPELLLLDLSLADDDGVDLCRRIRATGVRVPIVMLSPRDTVSDRIAGLEAGADDYLVAPFSLAELVARVRALLRRARDLTPGPARRLGDLTLDTSSREVRRGDRPVALTPREFDMLALFIEHPHTVIARERLLVEAWGLTSRVETGAVAVYVGYLRRKLEEAGEPRIIHTIRGVGYVLSLRAL